MGHGVASNGTTMLLHFPYHRGGKRATASVNVVLVEVDGEGELEFLQNGKGLGIDGFPAVIDGDDD